MYSITRIEELIKISEDTLAKYEKDLSSNPGSLFAKGMVKNTVERIEELRGNLAFEKRLREKEVVDLRLKGKQAKLGRLPLELLGNFAKQLSDLLIEAGRQYQFGNKANSKFNQQVKDSVKLEFERLIPGSTRILVTGTTNPDLFGNSILENALTNTFSVLQSDEKSILDASEKVGSGGIKKLNDILSTAVKNDLEFELNWQAPNDIRYSWNGIRENIVSLNNSISKIQVNSPLKIELYGEIIMLSIKGLMEIKKEEEKKTIKIIFPLSMLEKVKNLQIGDNCHFEILMKTMKNSITGEEKSTYELLNILPL